MQKALVYHNGGLIKTYEFDKRTLSIGRLPTNDISINSMAVSRNHLQLEYRDSVGAFVASDQQSLNGTLLNGVKIEQDTEIPSGSHLTIGQYSFTLDYTETSQNTTPSPVAQEPKAESKGSTGVSDTVTMSATQNTSTPPLTPNDHISEGTGTADIYFGGKEGQKKKSAVVSPSATAILIEQSTQMEHSIQKKEITFGNAQSDDIFIGEGKLAKITVVGKKHEIKALKVMGKIIVNGVKVGQHVLSDGDVFKVGKSTFTFKLVS